MSCANIASAEQGEPDDIASKVIRRAQVSKVRSPFGSIAAYIDVLTPIPDDESSPEPARPCQRQGQVWLGEAQYGQDRAQARHGAEAEAAELEQRRSLRHLIQQVGPLLQPPQPRLLSLDCTPLLRRPHQLRKHQCRIQESEIHTASHETSIQLAQSRKSPNDAHKIRVLEEQLPSPAILPSLP